MGSRLIKSMGSNVFGTALRAEKLTDIEAARAALADKNAGGKGSEARKYGEDLRQEAKEDGTICLIYNASGGALSLVDYHDWSGSVGRSPYPTRLENGQWGVFFHSQLNSIYSHAALVFDMHLHGYTDSQWVFAWYQSNHAKYNRCYSELWQKPPVEYEDSWGLEVKQYNGKEPKEWEALAANLHSGKSVHRLCSRSIQAYASIGNTNNPIFEAILTLPDPR